MKISLAACGRAASEKISYITCLSLFHDKHLLEMLNDEGLSIFLRYLTALLRKSLAFLSACIHLSGVHLQPLALLSETFLPYGCM